MRLQVDVPTVVQGQHTRCVYVGCNSLIVWEDRCICFKTLKKKRCLACNSFPHHWNKAEYSGDAPDDDDLDYNQHFIVIHSQPIIILIGVHWFIKFRTQSTLNLVVREILVSSPAPTENIFHSVGNIHKLKSFSCLDRELPCCIPIPPPMSTTAYVLINGIISTNLHFMKSTADAASCGCRLFQPTVVERQQTRCVYVGCNSLIVLGGQVYLFFKTLRKNRCLACNSF